MIRGEWLGGWPARLLLLAAMVGAGLVPVLSRHAQWLGSWKLALDWGTFGLTLLGPVAAGTACGTYVRLRRSQVDDLLGSAVRPWLGWVMPAVGVWLLAAAGAVLLCLATTTAAWLAGAEPYPAQSWVVLPALVVLGAEVALGALLGSLVRHYWAVPWAAVAVFLLFLLTKLHVVPVVFDTGATTGTLSGETFYPPWFAFQAVVALGLVTGMLALSHRPLFATASRPWQGFTLVTAAVALATLVVVDAPVERYAPLRSVPYVCRDGRPEVCLAEDARRPLDDLAARVQRLAEPLLSAGARPPSRFVPLVPGVPTPPGTGAIRFLDDEALASKVGDEVAARSLAVPTDCPAYSSDDPADLPEQYFTVVRLLVHWILVADGAEPVPSGDDPLASWWSLPTTEQQPWVRRTYAALSSCRLHDLRLPLPPGRSPR